MQLSQTADFLDASDGLANFSDQFANDKIPKNQTEHETVTAAATERKVT